ncbi:MAG: hypothetical protein HQK50_01700 [Oligoflexia bacterium]|nr:hypothetical protein [Oligoflexia bacterium]
MSVEKRNEELLMDIFYITDDETIEHYLNALLEGGFDCDGVQKSRISPAKGQGELMGKFESKNSKLVFLELSFGMERLVDDDKNKQSSLMTFEWLKCIKAKQFYLQADNIAVFLIGRVSNIPRVIWDKVSDYCSKEALIWGIIDVDHEQQLLLPTIKRVKELLMPSKTEATLVKEAQEKRKEDSVPVQKKRLLQLNQDINKLMENIEQEIKRAKKLHNRFAVKRQETIEGINILSKYTVGAGPGGEFFDIIKKKKKLILVLASTSSYVLSAMVIDHFTCLKENSEINIGKLEKFINDLNQTIISSQLLEKYSGHHRPLLQLLIVEIDFRKLEMQGYIVGRSGVISNKNYHILGSSNVDLSAPLDKNYFKWILSRGEKMIFLSPGFRENVRDVIGGEALYDFTLRKINEENCEITDELFYHLKKEAGDDFLKYDATTIIIEVSQNAIHEAPDVR